MPSAQGLKVGCCGFPLSLARRATSCSTISPCSQMPESSDSLPRSIESTRFK
jgi:hypothetical protein